jgi:hypothetical protein
VDGSFDLAVNTTGTTTFGGAIGSTTPLASLTTNAGGSTIALSVTTTGTQTYNDALTANGTYTTAGSLFTAASTTNLGGAMVVETGAGGATFSGTVNAGQTLTVNTNGVTTFSNAVGDTVALTSLTTNAGGTTAINGGGVTTTASQTYGDAVTLGANTTLSTSNANISFGSTLDGAQNLTLSSGTGNITFTGTVGTTRLGAVVINSVANVTASTNFNSASLSQVNGTGTTTFNGALDTNAAAGIDLNGSAFTFAQSVTTTGSGPFTITNSGQLTLPAAADLSLDGGAFTQDGTGDVLIAADITVSTAAPADAISFTGRVVVDGPVVFDTSATNKTIRFGATDDVFIGYSAASTSSFNAGSASIVFGRDLHIYIPDTTAASPLGFQSSVSARNIVKYAGVIDMNGKNLATSQDLVLFGNNGGSGYPDYNADETTLSVADLFSYDNAARTGGAFAVILADPSVSLISAIPLTVITFTDADYAGFVQDLGGSTISVGKNFYVNGGALLAGVAWSLVVPDNGDAKVSFAEAYNVEVQRCNASGGWVMAAENVIVALGGQNWDTGAAIFKPGTAGSATSGTVTVYDNVVRVEIASDASDTEGSKFENDSNEISIAASNIFLNNGVLAFIDTYTNPECTISTNGAGDLAVFYIKARFDTSAWNTDATGASAGNISSFDRGRSSATGDGDSVSLPRQNRQIIPNIEVVKASAVLFQTLRDHHKNRIFHYSGAARFTLVEDACRPVLISTEVGRDAVLDQTLLPDPWDGHNFIQYRYSEPVVLGSMNQTAVNEKSSATTGAGVGEWGGAYTATTMTGFAELNSGSVSLSARADSDAPNDDGLAASMVNGIYRGAPNIYGEHGIYISVAGWSYTFDGKQYWPGYFASAPVQPASGATVISLANPALTDLDGNVIEPDSNPYPRTGVLLQVTTDPTSATDWDVEAPEITAELIDAPGITYFDVIPLASSFNIDSFEMRFSEPVRDTSFYYRNGAAVLMTAGLPGWQFRNTDVATDAFRYGSTGFDTQVTSAAFGSVDKNVIDDVLVAMKPVTLNPNWSARSQMSFNYIQSAGLITDAAGNLLPDYSNGLCAEKLPPKIRFTSAEIGDTRIYLQFTEPVWHGTAGDRNLTGSDFTLTGSSLSVSDVEVFTDPDHPDAPVSEVWLQMSDLNTTEFALNSRIALSSNLVDRAGTAAETSVIRRAVDLAVGAVEVLGASDGVHTGDPTNTTDALATGALGLLRVFDGSGRLYDTDTTVFASLDLSGSASAATALSMYYDVAPAETYKPNIDITGRNPELGMFWLPAFQSGFNLAGNDQARSLNPFSAIGESRNFLVPSSDPEIASGAEIGFLYRFGDLWVARSTVAGDPRQFDLWRYKVQDIVKQRGGVTIMNNVIDANKHERTALNIELTEGGQVTVLVFTLDGDVVKSLHRGRLGAGTYTLTWNGTNAGGNPVARGVYFIRVVAPGIDEIRKVIVVKN